MQNRKIIPQPLSEETRSMMISLLTFLYIYFLTLYHNKKEEVTSPQPSATTSDRFPPTREMQIVMEWEMLIKIFNFTRPRIYTKKIINGNLVWIPENFPFISYQEFREDSINWAVNTQKNLCDYINKRWYLRALIALIPALEVDFQSLSSKDPDILPEVNIRKEKKSYADADLNQNDLVTDQLLRPIITYLCTQFSIKDFSNAFALEFHLNDDLRLLMDPRLLKLYLKRKVVFDQTWIEPLKKILKSLFAIFPDNKEMQKYYEDIELYIKKSTQPNKRTYSLDRNTISTSTFGLLTLPPSKKQKIDAEEDEAALLLSNLNPPSAP